MTLDEVNALPFPAFVAAFGGVYEHSPWVAEGAAVQRPFASREDMLKAFSGVVRQAGAARQIALVQAHPELGHRVGVDPALSEASAQEQGSAGLDRLSPADYAQFQSLNAAYRAKFGMPFVICVRKAGKAVILEAMARRLASTAEEELAEALAQIDAIASLRLQDKVPE
ncbi:2-oxo-4-hydroxy-4-carboxy-5-ureidoimidazoline decarboxylase [Acetobacter farinalis]|uniref:2-oxo-4-hydroxy-4-carboxy-5-ureidoimidazoline decarboxylase n=1 Tax=Acetobacter farinalis TaxID=1260984 RepID=A0ABT3Q7S9_9PROT|nr:2-oxo-4-hydroxy-4-carboxy-5-ureidoimidazoline decarboxylase [Acetobacter farinalis]MCX2561353.1 2-oxo-4-hydroxy-4-carboxy-5-ureidoimidazoline decarboxylase [Acetobacter farinalis]NHO30465.1 2-oxo-4-hydroxy-4-carboxy-5-ureidoimidazoline decarboxylase [Acetobacter farinalis]